jgi:IS30 family transposase
MTQKNYLQITVEQRYQMDVLLKAGYSKAHIAQELGIHRSTVYREIKRNSTIKLGNYTARQADEFAQERKERFKKHRVFTLSMKKFIDNKILQEEWSPEQIKGYCQKQDIPMVSHERIYQYIYQNKAQGGILYQHLRVTKKFRKRYGTNNKRCSNIKDRVSIELRPNIVNEKSRYGDWEADTIIGANQKGAILTMVERKSLFTLMSQVEKKNSTNISKQMINLMAPYKQLVLTITTDNGTEFAQHKRVAKKLETDCYFAHPYTSWERGLNENTNGLIRQYIPKKAKFDNILLSEILTINHKLNTRPRKSLGFKTPMQVFMTSLNQNHCRTW